MSLPPPDPTALARQVALLRAMGGPGSVPGYSEAERSLIRDRIAEALGRAANRFAK